MLSDMRVRVGGWDSFLLKKNFLNRGDEMRVEGGVELVELVEFYHHYL